MGKNQAVERAEYLAESIGRMAYQALLEEVYTVPKPGLVDPYSCGAHNDYLLFFNKFLLFLDIFEFFHIVLTNELNFLTL